MKLYTLLTANDDLAPAKTFSRKDRAVKAGEATGVDFTVISPAGKVVHEYTAPVEAKPATKKVEVVAEVGETIRGLVTVEINRTCKKGADHEFRVTQSGTYCYTCDRIAAEAQKAARAAAKAGTTRLTLVS